MCLLDRKSPLVLHGDGTNTRRYLYAGDSADAFDTILHKGEIGEIYNVGSYDEISNAAMASKILAQFNIPATEDRSWIQYTKDRPFNDMRYAVDGTKLRALGWEQKTPFEHGLRITVEWYRKFGRRWWGNIDSVLTPFPVVHDGEVYADRDTKKQAPATTTYGNGTSKKRPSDDKENEEIRSQKRALLGESVDGGNSAMIR